MENQPPTIQTRARDAVARVEREYSGWMSRHWADVLVLGGGVVLIARLLHVIATARGAPVAPEVRAARDLPAYALLRPADLRADAGLPPDSVARVFGRYLVHPLRAGSPIRAVDVGPASVTSTMLQGRYTLPLQITPGSAPDSLRAGDVVHALATATDASVQTSGMVLHDIPVLAVTPIEGGTRVVVAVTGAQLERLGSVLGSSRVHLMGGGNARSSVPAAARAVSPAVRR